MANLAYNRTISPVSLYGEHLEELLKYFNMEPERLKHESSDVFRNLIYKQISQAVIHPVIIQSPPHDPVWLNTTRPLHFEDDLQHKIYVIDFFTYCCINCIHVIPYFKEVEEEFKNLASFAVIGVHSPKFPNERNTERVKEALILNRISHPVINDSNRFLWKKYGLTCWPTAFIVGPKNMLLFILEGEHQIANLPFLCQIVYQYYVENGFRLNMDQIPSSHLEKLDKDLLFPSNLSSNNELLVVTDTGHHRLLVMSAKLEVQIIIGSSSPGYEDGSFEKASFNAPHGTALFNGSIFVADTGNHCIRKVDLQTKRISTLFKIIQGPPVSEEILKKFAQNPEFIKEQNVKFQSPWDVCVGPKLGSDFKELNVLYIAVAGSHQIWSLYLDTNLCVPFAGSGKEENRQNCYRLQSGFAQPSGIDYSEVIQELLFVADSESSTIKCISLIDGSVKIIVGGNLDPCDLFGFGDLDGKGRGVKLQHPTGICVINHNLVVIADTYNHKIKLINVSEKLCDTLKTERVLTLCEPSDICTMNDKLVIADKNNHRVQFFSISELISPILCPPLLTKYEFYGTAQDIMPLNQISLRFDGEVLCYFEQERHEKYTITDIDPPWDVTFEGSAKCTVKNNLVPLFEPKNYFTTNPPIVIKGAYPISSVYSPGMQCILTFTVNTTLCNSIENVCLTKDLLFKLPIQFSKMGAKTVEVRFKAILDL